MLWRDLISTNYKCVFESQTLANSTRSAWVARFGWLVRALNTSKICWSYELIHVKSFIAKWKLVSLWTSQDNHRRSDWGRQRWLGNYQTKFCISKWGVVFFWWNDKRKLKIEVERRQRQKFKRFPLKNKNNHKFSSKLKPKVEIF